MNNNSVFYMEFNLQQKLDILSLEISSGVFVGK